LVPSIGKAGILRSWAIPLAHLGVSVQSYRMGMSLLSVYSAATVEIGVDGLKEEYSNFTLP
jgi:hypothetical protein